MKIILFLSHCCVIDNEQRSFRSFSLSTRRDWLCSSIRLRFYHLICLKFSAELFLFVIFSTFSFVLVQLFFIYRLLSRSLRNHYLTLSLFSIWRSIVSQISWSRTCFQLNIVNFWMSLIKRHSILLSRIVSTIIKSHWKKMLSSSIHLYTKCSKRNWKSSRNISRTISKRDLLSQVVRHSHRQ
jgi:hypothetical protein